MLFRILIIFLLVSASCELQGQYGVRATYNLNNANNWNQFLQQVGKQQQDIFNRSVGFSIDYWLRMKNTRIEFYPYLSYHQNSDIVSNNGSGITTGSTFLALRQFGFGLTTHFYLFDFFGDCECPTFSKQGGFLKKGFFLMAGIGADLSQKRIGDFGYRDSNIDTKFSGGAGLDIGLNDLITLSPFIQYQYYPSISWHELGTSFNRQPEHVESSLQQIQFGLRIGFRPDYKL